MVSRSLFQGSAMLSENDIAVNRLLGRFRVGSVGSGRQKLLLLGFARLNVSLLLVLGALKTEELLTLQLVKLALNVFNRIHNLGDDDCVERIHAPRCDFDGLIEDDKAGLQRGELYEHVDRFRKSGARLCNLLTTLGKSCS